MELKLLPCSAVVLLSMQEQILVQLLRTKEDSRELEQQISGLLSMVLQHQ